MKKILLLMLFVVVGFKATASDAKISPPARVDTSLLIQDDRFVPWPWSLKKTFPWAMVEGTWLAQNGAFQSYFTFKIYREDQVRRFVIRQIDLMTCEEVAYGQGSAARTTNRLMSDMYYIDVRQNYGIYVRAYEYNGPVEDLNVSPIDGQVMMLSIQPEGRKDYVHLGISKISDDPVASFCKPKSK